MKVRDVMSVLPTTLDSEAKIKDAAKIMAERALGALPIAHNDRVVGFLTDRDITCNVVAMNLSPDTKIREIITGELIYCFEDDDVEIALQLMQEERVQRLIVLDNDTEKDLVGVLSIADVADRCDEPELALEITRCCRHY